MASSSWSLRDNVGSEKCWRLSRSLFIFQYDMSIGLHSLSFLCSELFVYDTVKLAVVSNFDTRLRKLLKDLGVLEL